MRLHQTDQGVHEVTCHAWKLPLVFAGVSIWFAVILVQNLIFGSTERNPIVGPLIGFAITGVGAVMFYERGRFIFDAVRRVVTWHRSGVTGTKRGRFTFDAIRGIRLESQPAAGRRTPGKRVVIETETGTVPMTRAYQGQGVDNLQSIVHCLTAVVLNQGNGRNGSQLEHASDG